MEGNWKRYCCFKQRHLRADSAKEIEEHLEDEDALQDRESIIFDTTQSALKWLGLSIQCSEAVIMLTKRLTPKNTVCFRPIIVPKTVAQKGQASLDTLVKAVVGDPSFEAAKKRLQAIALKNQWDHLLATNWNDFCGSFNGKVHCESTIASIKSATPPLIKKLPEETRASFEKLVEEVKVMLPDRIPHHQRSKTS